MSLRYVDEVPTVPGWYWERREDSTRILYLPHCGYWPKPWQKHKEESLEAASGEMLEKLLELPEEAWKVEYAGPIPEPVN